MKKWVKGETYTQRILRRSELDVKTGCINYRMSKRLGYGFLNYKGKNKSASRIILIESTGLYESDPSMFACHKCNNRACVNINHLYWGTRLDNVRDMCEVGNHNWHKNPRSAEKHPTAKFTNEQVRELRRLNKEFGYGNTTLAKMFGYNKNAVNNILYGKNRFKGI